MLRTGQKSDIIGCVGAPKGRSPTARNVSMMVIDGPAMVHMVTPMKAITFKDYVPQHIVPFLKAQTTPTVTRIDVVWDIYPENSLKDQAQARRGSGPRTQLGPDGPSPIPQREWKKFLANKQNKEDLFNFIGTELSKVNMNNLALLSTKEDKVVANKPYEMTTLQDCNHVEADTRMICSLPLQSHNEQFGS